MRFKFRFFTIDGSNIETIITGEGLDTSDKVANKCLSIAHKYALLTTFCIPTQEVAKDFQGDSVHPVDPDSETIETINNSTNSNISENPSAEKRKALKIRWIG